MSKDLIFEDLNRDTFDHKNQSEYQKKFAKGLSEDVVRSISKDKDEPEWMLEFRLKSLATYNDMPMPTWGPDLSGLNLDSITYFAKSDAKANSKSWDDVPEDIKNTFERLGIPEAERKVLAGVGAQYECLSQDTLVYTVSKGMVPIKNIKVGDKVFSLDEKNKKIVGAKVLGVLEKGTNSVYELTADNRKIKATDNHPFLVLDYSKDDSKTRGRFKKIWKPLKEIQIGDLVAIPKNLDFGGIDYDLVNPLVRDKAVGENKFGTKYEFSIKHNYNEVNLPLKISEDLMWLLGMFIGDGYIKLEKGRDKKRVCFAIPETQKQLQDELSEVISRLFGSDLVSFYKDKIILNSTIIADFFICNGFTGNSKTKRIPEWVYSQSQDLKLAFLAGYVDSDGYVANKNRGYNVILKAANFELMKDFSILSELVNLHSSFIHTVNSKHPFEKDRVMVAYSITITGELKKIPSRYDFKKTRLLRERRYRNFSSVKGTTFRNHVSENLGFVKVSAIAPIGKDVVYDIEVEGHHNFVAEGLIVHNSEVVYHSLKKEWEDKGVIFEDCDVALRKYPELFKKYFMKCVPFNDHKFAALHGAVWSGGTFLYIPKGVKLDMPLQAYFRMNAPNQGQFEHTLIIVEDDAVAHYIEGCSAPKYGSNALHAGCVEIYVGKRSKARYSSVENWSKDTYNLNTKRAIVDEYATMEWVGGNMGSGVTMLYPCTILKGRGAHADHLGVAFANTGQIQDTGAKIVHAAPDTSCNVVMKSLSKGGGVSMYRGLLQVNPNAYNVTARVECDALILDDYSRSDTVPDMKIMNNDVTIAHEATAGKLNDDDIFYLTSRGIDEEAAKGMIVNGFIEPIVRELPMEYAVELNRLIELEMEGSVG